MLERDKRWADEGRGRRDGGDGGGGRGRVVCFGMGRWHGWGCLLFGR